MGKGKVIDLATAPREELVEKIKNLRISVQETQDCYRRSNEECTCLTRILHSIRKTLKENLVW